MESQRWHRRKELFQLALQQPEEARAQYLESACEGDEELRREVEALLSSLDEAESFLELPTHIGLLPEALDEKLISTRIGGYLLKRVISHGGMGTVYEALQENPEREVAIKVLRDGIASRDAMRRFEYESRILARLTHPHVAQIIEAGTHRGEGKERGLRLPYFVMEFIRDARSITDYSRARGLSIRERLQLFLPVCAAVHFGHQKGIIHRDLKPSNILVNPDSLVKVIDFGVARAIDSDLAVTTMLTDVGQLIGTLQYMSPEQCKGDPADLDTRSDVYALGVVLYELLCEALPYDISRSVVFEATRVICEKEPRRPSTTHRALRGDVETIVLKALEKERENRYQTVADLESDIRRYLAGDFILARPVGPATRLYKRVRRNPYLSAAVSVAALATIGFFLYVTLWSYPRIVTEKDRALSAEREADRQRESALTAMADMERESRKAQAINTFLEQMLLSPSPRGDGRDVKMIDVLNRSADLIDNAFAEQPEIEMSLRRTIGWTYSSLGDYAKAEHHLGIGLELARETLGEESPETLRYRASLAQVHKAQGRFDEAENSLREILAAQTRRLGDGHVDVAESRSLLGETLRRKGRLGEAEGLLDEAVAVYLDTRGEEAEETLDSMLSLCNVYNDQGRDADTEELLRRIVEIQKRAPGVRAAQRVATMNSLAIVLKGRLEYDDAEVIYREAAELGRSALGEEHPMTLSVLHNLSRLLYTQGKSGEADPIMREVIEVRKRVLGSDHVDVATSLNTLAISLNSRGRPREAEPVLRKVLQIQQKALGPLHRRSLDTENNIAISLQFQGRLDEAIEVNERVLRGRTESLGADHSDTVGSMCNLAGLRMIQGDNAGAEVIFREVVDRWTLTLGRTHPATMGTKCNLGCAVAQLGRFDESLVLHREVLEARRESLGPRHSDTLISMVEVAISLIGLERSEEAEELLLEGLEIAEEVLPAGHEVILRFHTRLGDCLIGQSEYEEAEARLMTAYEGFRKSLGDSHHKVRTTMSLLIRLYTEWDRPEQAEAWREKRAR
jgi:eukaryotic-like serine/threonine-protein kinase